MPLPQGELLGSEEVQQNVSTRFEQACMELKAKGERQRAEKALKEQEEQRAAAREEARRPAKERLEYMKNSDDVFTADMYKRQSNQDEEDRDAVLDDDDELDALRLARINKMKKQKAQMQENLAKGHGVYDEVFEENFLKTVLASKFCVAHFFHEDFERCKIMDKHLKLLATNHVEARFFKINAEKALFFVEKLEIRTLPTVVFFQDGKAIDKLLGFNGLPNGDEFSTRDLEERIGITGCIKMERGFYEERADDAPKKVVSTITRGKVSRTEDFEDPFDD
ncbi:Thioredoxin domain-containing protein 9 [Hondaea fermentalgiana]|uniref:Thioredoxin domain-containing protein 9 n=1 Tax=Hondaea fermentalgiana TaxID=2315210 RepID=A0A2R5GG42_9STRA|nr:Thioredoxin domain-containing protein 9 [Hondaea fermentalgiana]|eukprot:GBG27211.1 Thioredoxin domain-containing protein 9 [Hondaea fermentalgiana]